MEIRRRTREADVLFGGPGEVRATSDHTLFESIDEGFCIIEMVFEGDEPVDYRFVQVNPAFEHHTGLRDAVGRRARELVPGHEAFWFQTYGRVARTGEPIRFERAAPSLGRHFAVYAFRVGPAARRRVAVLFNDITQCKRAEAEHERLLDELGETQAAVQADLDALKRLQQVSSLFLSQASLEPVLGEIVEAAIAVSGADFGNIQLLDPESCELRIVAWRGFPDWWIDHWRVITDDRGSCGTALSRRERVIVEDVLGSPIFAGTPGLEAQLGAGVRAVQSTPLVTRSGQPLGVLNTHWKRPGRPDDRTLRLVDVLARQAADILDRSRAEEALRRANEQLVQADRLKNEFLSVLSHELRNPLAPIKTSLYILDHAMPGSEQARRAQTVLARQVDQLTRLVDDLLDVNRITRNKIHLRRQRLELNELLARTVEDYRPMFDRAGVPLELLPAGTPVFVDADWNRLAQVVGNLLHNAAKFTHAGGRARVSLAANEAAGRAILRVADTGTGLPPGAADWVFEPFTQGESSVARSQGGLGLGLALVRGLVELHGGEVTASSAGVGKGSVFTVELPLERGSQAAVRLESKPAPRSPRRVLVIEDNKDAAQSLREALELDGHDVQVARDGKEGIAKARAFRPDVVLCDLGLPGMDGYSVARALRKDEALEGTRLIALSGYALPEDLQRAADAGFEQHIAKPANREELERVLRGMPGE